MIAGIYIMQNTMVWWGGVGRQEKNRKLRIGEKMRKGKEKRRKITYKTVKKALKIHLFGL